MSVSPYLPGLLSRMGPSLYSPALMYAAEPSRFFSTNTFLEAFQAQPETGDLFMPVVSNGSASTEMTLAAVEGDTFASCRHTLQTLIQEGLRFTAADEALISRTYPLPATGGDWSVGDRAGEGAETALNFSHAKSRRFIRLQGYADGGLSVTAGWQSSQVRVSQEVAMNGGGQLIPGGYQIEFKGAALESLRTYLKMPSAPGAELALALASQIYASGQYTPDESGCSLAVMGPKGRWRLLSKNEARWSLPEELRTLNPLMIGTRNQLLKRDGSRTRQPVADTYWESGEGRYGHLMVRLHNLPGRKLPLDPQLKNLLWDGALGLLYSEGRG